MNFNLTDEELAKMPEEEFFTYLDAKAEYMRTYAKKLSPYHIKNYSAITSAISKTDFDYESTKKIITKNK